MFSIKKLFLFGFMGIGVVEFGWDRNFDYFK